MNWAQESFFNTHHMGEVLNSPLTLFWAMVTVVAVTMACVVLTRFRPKEEY